MLDYENSIFFFGLLSTFLKEGLRNLAEMCPRMKLDCRK